MKNSRYFWFWSQLITIYLSFLIGVCVCLFSELSAGTVLVSTLSSPDFFTFTVTVLQEHLATCEYQGKSAVWMSGPGVNRLPPVLTWLTLVLYKILWEKNPCTHFVSPCHLTPGCRGWSLLQPFHSEPHRDPQPPTLTPRGYSPSCFSVDCGWSQRAWCLDSLTFLPLVDLKKVLVKSHKSSGRPLLRSTPKTKKGRTLLSLSCWKKSKVDFEGHLFQLNNGGVVSSPASLAFDASTNAF